MVAFYWLAILFIVLFCVIAGLIGFGIASVILWIKKVKVAAIITTVLGGICLVLIILVAVLLVSLNAI